MSATTTSQPQRLPLPEGERWRPLRAGIQGLWQYDRQEFAFRRGRLLLRGRNESGKTKALELLLPFLLDADLRPERLDPFGTQARSMRWNLLQGEEAEGKVRIGYVWMELGRVGTGGPEFLTLGAGLRARRSDGDVDVWYFQTPRRVGESLLLLDERRAPVVRKELAGRLGDGGRLFEGAAEYRAAVNERLFGMAPEQYDALISTLLQLRRPHLSEKLDPEALSEILGTALPPLDAGVVGKLADGFEGIDRHRAEGEAAAAALRQLQGFLDVYRAYAGAVAKLGARALLDAERALAGAVKALEGRKREREEADGRCAGLAADIAAAEEEWAGVEGRLAALRSSEEYRAAEALGRAEEEARAAAGRLDLAERRLSQDGEAAARAGRVAAAEKARLDALRADRDRDSQAMIAAAEAADLGGAAREIAREATAGDGTAARGLLGAVLSGRERAAKEVEVRALSAESAGAAHQRAEETAREGAEWVRAAEEVLSRREAEAGEASAGFREEVRTWLDGLTVFAPAPAARSRIEETEPRQAGHLARGEAEAARAALDGRAARAGAEALRIERAAAELRAEIANLESRPEPSPASPPWRGERPAGRKGAPLYLLCDLRDAADAQAAPVEAALEASGLLDAWVEPDGTVLDRLTRDLVLRPAPLAGATLADLLAAVPRGDVSKAAVERVLRSVRLVGAGKEAEAGCAAWVSADGRFGLGPLQGANAKEEVAWLGTPARARERARRIAERRGRLVALEAEAAAAGAERAEVDRLREALRAELERFPDASAVVKAEAAAEAAGLALGTERARAAELAEAAARAARAFEAAVLDRDRAAAEAGLQRWVNALAELRELTADFRLAAERLLASGREAAEADARSAEREGERAAAEARASDSKAERDRSAAEARGLAERAAALREVAGAGRDEVLGKVRAAEERRKSLAEALRQERAMAGEAGREAGHARAAEEQAAAAVASAEVGRAEAEAAFRDLAGHGLVALAGVAAEEPSAWGHAGAAETARRVEGEVAGRGDAAARDGVENRVTQRHNDLARSLPPEVRLTPERRGGVLFYAATWNGRTRPIQELVPALQAEIAEGRRLLGEEEARLVESFLSGEAHAHLGARLRQAHELVARIREQLAACPTASGQRLGLDWDLGDEAPAGAREAIDLFRREGKLLTSANREALAEFLRDRLARARGGELGGTLRERMLRELDYRPWFRFEVKFRSPEGEWKRLTRRAHAAGSGGQKAVMLHLPLFAAAAAFYASARPEAPRLVVLDEAFAGIDRPMRAQLMGLLAALDLDFVMTSHDEWGFYEELDGLSTYHLSRQPGLPGVLAEWFLWDGRASTQVEER